MFRLDLPTTWLLMTGFMEQLSEEVSLESRRLLGIIGRPSAPTQLLERVRELGTYAAMKLSVNRHRQS